MLKLLMTRPSVDDVGGVTAFINNISGHFADNGIAIEFLEIGSTRGRVLHPVTDQLALQRRIRAREINLVHINPSLMRKSFFRDGLFAWQIKARCLPLLVFFHGWSDSFAEEIEARWMWFFRATFARADAFVVLGSDFESKLRQWGFKGPIYRGTTAVDERLIAGFDLEEKLNNAEAPERYRVLFLARLEPDKGVYETIDACSLLDAKGIPLQLVIAGDGPEEAKIREYARIKLGDRVSFSGYVRGSAKAKVFSEAHVYAMPTYYGEGLPGSILEAMAFGLPIVTRPVGGIKDFFIDRGHGLLTESKDPAVIAALIEELLINRDLWLRTSRGARQYAMERFVGSAVALALIQAYREVVGFDRLRDDGPVEGL